MDIPARPRIDLFLGILFAPLSNQGPDWPAGNSSRERLPRRRRRIAPRPQPLLVRAIPLLVLLQFTHADGDHLDRLARIRLRLPQSLAAPQLLRLLRLLPLVRLRIRATSPATNPTACCSKPASSPSSSRLADSARLGREAPALARQPLPLAMGVVPHLLRIRHGQAAQRRSPMA